MGHLLPGAARRLRHRPTTTSASSPAASTRTSDGATVRFVSGRTETADLVVFADGITSIGPRAARPDRQLTYSGYVGWRGTVPEHELTDAHPRAAAATRSPTASCRTPTSRSTRSRARPAPDRGTEPGDRLMNYVWYRNVPAGPELSEMLIDKRGIPGQVSLHPGQVQDRYVDEMRAAAARMLGAGRRRGGHRDRHAVRAGGAGRPVVQDGRRPGRADRRRRLRRPPARRRGHRQGRRRRLGAVGALWSRPTATSRRRCASGSPAQLALSAALLDRVVDMGERSQFRNTWVPGDPSLRFGLYGPGR